MKLLSCYLCCLLQHLLELAALQERDRASESPVVAAADELALDEHLRHACFSSESLEFGLLGVRYFDVLELDARLFERGLGLLAVRAPRPESELGYSEQAL